MSYLTEKENSFAINQQSEITLEVTIGTTIGVTVPTHVGSIICIAFIDTGATGSCISESYFHILMLSNLKHTTNISVRSALGEYLYPIGLIICTFCLGKKNLYLQFYGI